MKFSISFYLIAVVPLALLVASPAIASDSRVVLILGSPLGSLYTEHIGVDGSSWGDFLDWIRNAIHQYIQNAQGGGYSWNFTPRGSVPIPGTLLLFGGGFAALVIWRTRRSRP
jgi:hypothetical protein